jgi:predicted metal-dependent phosphoesterase TrpH
MFPTMQLKTNFHFHTSDDPRDPVTYTMEQGIDRAARHGFGALAVTCHQKFAWTEGAAEYAEKRGILLIPGIELYVDETRGTWGRHVLIINAKQEAEGVRTFAELAEYKRSHPESFIIAPHPYFYGNFSLHEFLEKHIHLFDAIEHSWFYSGIFNRNVKGREIAEKYDLPFVATSDTHFFDFLNTDYSVIEVEEKTPEALFEALRKKNFNNVTSQKSFFKDMVWKEGKFIMKRHRNKHVSG